MPFRLGIIEIILILVIIFIIFGAGKLPQLFDMFVKGARSLSGRKKSEETKEVKMNFLDAVVMLKAVGSFEVAVSKKGFRRKL